MTISGIIAVIIVIGIGIGYLIYRHLHPTYSLSVKYVSNEPKLDGKGDDAVWKSAPAVTIPVKNGDPVTVKSVYTRDKVFFMARYKDPTENAIYKPWEFDGTHWRIGSNSDGMLLFFDIDDSIKDFPSKGFGVMDYGFGTKDEIYQFGQTGKRQKKGYWPGYKGRADVWIMGAGYTTAFGQADDTYFSVDPNYLRDPMGAVPRLVLMWDQFTTPEAIKLNTVIWRENKKLSEGQTVEATIENKPDLTYIDKTKNLNNTPYPLESDLTPIIDYGEFKAGDMLPSVYFRDKKPGKWGGSRDDVAAMMGYKNGYWTVEASRKLDTKHPDDITFRPGDGKPVWFGAVVRTGDQTLRYTVPATLEFAPKGGG